jgi:hypothetical protein
MQCLGVSIADLECTLNDLLDRERKAKISRANDHDTMALQIYLASKK